MLRWVPAVLILVLGAGVLGMLETAPPAAALARLLFFVLGVVFLFLLIGGLVRRT